MSDHECDICGKTYKTRSGLWKHKKSKHDESLSAGVDESPKPSPTDLPPTDPPADTPMIEEETSSFTWSDFDFGSGDDATETIPAPLKSIVNAPARAGESKLTKAEREALEKQNKGILKMMLTWIDLGLTRYGKAVSLDDDFEVKHSDQDKDLVANAQYRYLEEKGLFLTNYLSTGMIAGSLTVWYIGTPMMRIRKNAKKTLIRGRFLARLPLIGRLFKRKTEVAPIAQTVVDE